MSTSSPGSAERARRWDEVYENCGELGVSWFQLTPAVSLELIGLLDIPLDAAVIDVGGGASSLVDRLVDRGFSDLSVLDVSGAALEATRHRLGGDVPITFLEEDVLVWHPERRFHLWHDRAVFHFLVDGADRARYLATLRSAIQPGGFVIIATFAPDGPESCSGLPVARYSADSLGSVLGSDFVVVETRREEHTTPGGAVQPFAWVAARATATRDTSTT
jgi:Methyltransferase domain